MRTNLGRRTKAAQNEDCGECTVTETVSDGLSGEVQVVVPPAPICHTPMSNCQLKDPVRLRLPAAGPGAQLKRLSGRAVWPRLIETTVRRRHAEITHRRGFNKLVREPNLTLP